MLSAVHADSSSERRRRALLDNGEQGDVDTEQGSNQAQAPAERLPDPPQRAQRSADSGRVTDAQPSARRSEAVSGAADPIWDDWAWGGGNAAGRYQQQRASASGSRCSFLQIVLQQQATPLLLLREHRHDVPVRHAVQVGHAQQPAGGQWRRGWAFH